MDSNYEFPCKTYLPNEKGGLTWSKPKIMCAKKCASCGWNPEEQERRLKTGKIDERTVTHVLHNDLGEAVSIITKPCKVLTFKGVRA